MYWDVIEVEPEPDYCLFVRFRNGVSGRVRFDPGEFTGVLQPLRDREFFKRVYVDEGTPAWPGDIDLAPDALYRQIATEPEARQRAS